MDEQMNVSETVVEPKAEEETVNQVETEEKKVKKMDKETVKKIIKDAVSPENLKKTIGIALAVIAVIIGSIFLIKSRSPEAVAVRFVKASLIQDNAVVEKLLVYDLKDEIRVHPPYTSKYYFDKDNRPDDEDLFEKCADYYNEDIESWKDLYAVQKKSQMETWEDQFGKFKITAEVTRTKDLSEKKAKSVLSGWMDVLETYGFDTDQIKECKQVSLKVKLIGEDKTDKETVQVYLCKLNGSWRVVNYSG